MLTYLDTQTNFWLLINLLLAAMLNLHAHLIGQILSARSRAPRPDAANGCDTSGGGMALGLIGY
jgi:hypothetical protein